MSVAVKIAGTLAGHEHFACRVRRVDQLAAVLAVSLSPGVGDSGRDRQFAAGEAWALAVAANCSLVLCELVHVAAADVGLKRCAER